MTRCSLAVLVTSAHTQIEKKKRLMRVVREQYTNHFVFLYCLPYGCNIIRFTWEREMTVVFASHGRWNAKWLRFITCFPHFSILGLLSIYFLKFIWNNQRIFLNSVLRDMKYRLKTVLCCRSDFINYRWLLLWSLEVSLMVFESSIVNQLIV